MLTPRFKNSSINTKRVKNQMYLFLGIPPFQNGYIRLILALILTTVMAYLLRNKERSCTGEIDGSKIYENSSFQTKNYFPEAKRFFVIAVIFNPASYSSRYRLYHNFVQHMEETGAQLITIECIFPSLNQSQFQVTNAKNPFHIQLKSDSIYWMKENLINIAVSRLPQHAKWVAWLDADISFHEKNWVELTIKQLKQYSVVQMFRDVNFLGPQPENEVLKREYSFGYSVVHGKIIDQRRYREWYPHPGLGWATSVKTFRKIGGLPEYDILGSSDLHFAFTLIQKVKFPKPYEYELNSHFKKAVMNYSEETFKKLMFINKFDQTSILGYVPVTMSHYWHGSMKDRQYKHRWDIFISNDFNFLTDLKKERNGLYILASDKTSLQRDIIDYFQTRREDGKITEKDDYKNEKNQAIAKNQSYVPANCVISPGMQNSYEELQGKLLCMHSRRL